MPEIPRMWDRRGGFFVEFRLRQTSFLVKFGSADPHFFGENVRKCAEIARKLREECAEIEFPHISARFSAHFCRNCAENGRSLQVRPEISGLTRTLPAAHGHSRAHLDALEHTRTFAPFSIVVQTNGETDLTQTPKNPSSLPPHLSRKIK